MYGTGGMRLRTLEHIVVALVVGAGIVVGAGSAMVFGFHRSVVLGVIVVIDVCVALTLGVVLLDRQRQKRAWVRFVGSMTAHVPPDVPSSLRAQVEAVRRKLSVDGVALLLGERGQPPSVGAHCGVVPRHLRD